MAGPIALTIAASTSASSAATLDPANRSLALFVVGSNDVVTLEFATSSGSFPGYTLQSQVGSGDWRVTPTSAGVVAIVERPPSPWFRLRTPSSVTSAITATALPLQRV